MAQNKILYTSVALTTTTTTNILQPPAIASAGLWSPLGAAQAGNCFMKILAIRVTNKTAASAQFALWRDTTGGNTAGKEFVFGGVASAGALTRGQAVAATSYIERFGAWRLDQSEFIVGGTDTATALLISFEYEIGVA